MNWFQYDNGLRHERVKRVEKLLKDLFFSVWCHNFPQIVSQKNE